jgi:hypothetical protein
LNTVINGRIKEAEMGGTCGIRGGGKMHTGVWCGNLKEIDHLEDLVIDWKLV